MSDPMDHIKEIWKEIHRIDEYLDEVERRLSQLEEREGIPKGWMNFREARRYLNVGKTTLFRWIKKGKLKTYKSTAGKAIRFRLEDLDAVMKPIEIGEDIIEGADDEND